MNDILFLISFAWPLILFAPEEEAYSKETKSGLGKYNDRVLHTGVWMPLLKKSLII